MGTGIFAFAPLMDLAYEHYGSTRFFIVMATMPANVVTLGTLYFPSKLEIHSHKQREIDAASGNIDNKLVGTLKMYSKCIIKKPILLFSIATFGFCGGTDLIFLNFPTFIVYKGFSSIQAALIVSLNGLLSVIGRFITGLLANCKKIYVIWLYSGFLSVASAATVIYQSVAGFLEGHVIFSSILGLFFGSGYVLISPLCSYFVDIQFASAAIGLVLFFGGVGSFVGSMFSGILLDAGGTYDQCIYSAGGFVLMASVLCLLTSSFRRKVISSDPDPIVVRFSPI